MCSGNPVGDLWNSASKSLDDIGTSIAKTADEIGSSIAKSADDLGSSAAKTFDDIGSSIAKTADEVGTSVSDMLHASGSLLNLAIFGSDKSSSGAVDEVKDEDVFLNPYSGQNVSDEGVRRRKAYSRIRRGMYDTMKFGQFNMMEKPRLDVKGLKNVLGA